MFFPFYLDPSYLVLLLFMTLVGGAAQFYVNSTYRRFSGVPLATGRTGAEVARAMLDSQGLGDVGIERVSGNLTDHYDPRARVLRLSPGVHDGRTVSAAGVASHEAGHAVQHARAFAAAKLRQALVPAANIGSALAWPLIFIGLLFGGGSLQWLVTVGIALYGLAVLFTLVTLPVEFDASRRALAYLRSGGLPEGDVNGARSVLRAAALTYVAATLVAVVQLLYLVGLSRRN